MSPARTLAPEVLPGPEAPISPAVHTGVELARPLAVRWRAYFALTKPGITAMVMVTVLAGFLMAGGRDTRALAAALAGAGLAAAGSCALNMWVERESDRRMRRTMTRPIPAGIVAPSDAAHFGILLGIAGVAILALGTNYATAAIGGATLLTYIGLYTPLKKRTAYAFFVGAADGAAGPLLGWCAVRGMPEAEAWALFAILFVWQFPHFNAIVRMNGDDFARAGFPTFAGSPLPSAVALVLVSLAPYFLGMAGAAYLTGAIMMGLAFLVFAAMPRLQARPLFIASLVWLPVVLGVLTLGR